MSWGKHSQNADRSARGPFLYKITEHGRNVV